MQLTRVPSEKVDTVRSVRSSFDKRIFACPRSLREPVKESSILRPLGSNFAASLFWNTDDVEQCTQQAKLQSVLRFALPHTLHRKPRKVCLRSFRGSRLAADEVALVLGLPAWLRIRVVLSVKEISVSEPF